MIQEDANSIWKIYNKTVNGKKIKNKTERGWYSH